MKQVLTALNEQAGAHKASQVDEVCRHVVGLSSRRVVTCRAQLAEAVEYLVSNVVQPLESNDQAKLKKNLFHLNTRLMTTTFLADNKPTLADFFYVPTLKGLLVSVCVREKRALVSWRRCVTRQSCLCQAGWSPKEQAIYGNITRFYNHIQHLDEVDVGEKLALVQTAPPAEKKPPKDKPVDGAASAASDAKPAKDAKAGAKDASAAKDAKVAAAGPTAAAAAKPVKEPVAAAATTSADAAATASTSDAAAKPGALDGGVRCGGAQ